MTMTIKVKVPTSRTLRMRVGLAVILIEAAGVLIKVAGWVVGYPVNVEKEEQ